MDVKAQSTTFKYIEFRAHCIPSRAKMKVEWDHREQGCLQPLQNVYSYVLIIYIQTHNYKHKQIQNRIKSRPWVKTALRPPPWRKINSPPFFQEKVWKIDGIGFSP